MATPINTVPLGQAGTGSAFVLGESQAANQLLDTLQYNQKIQQQQELLKQQQAQQLAANWQKNQLKVDGGLYWQQEFNKRAQDHIQKGIELRQMGIDPFNYNPSDPMQAEASNEYLLERQGILADTADRKAREAELQKSFDMVRKNPGNYYSRDVAALNKIIETPYAQARGMQIPALTQRFNPNEVLSKVTPAQEGSELVVGNKRIKSVKALIPETRAAVISTISNDPQSQRWVDEITGNQGFTIPVLESIPNTKEAVKSKLEAQYKGNPDLRTQLAIEGITPDSDAYKKYINQETDRLYAAKNRWNTEVENGMAQVLPKVKGMSSILNDFSDEDQAIQRERLAIARRTEARLAEDAANGGGDSEAIYRQGEIDDIWAERNSASGEGNAVKRLKAAVEANPLFQGANANTMFRDNGRWINVTIPERKVAYTTTNAEGEEVERFRKQDSYKVTIDKRNPQDKIKLNKVLDVLKGTKISEDKLQTGNAGGKVKGTIYTEKGTNSKPTTRPKKDPLGLF